MSILLFFAAATAPATPAPQRITLIQSTMVFAQLTPQRINVRRVRPIQPSLINDEPMRWKEKDGPSCIKWSTIAAAMISSKNTLDVILRGGKRYRVKLNKSCQASEFYSDFYVKTTSDGQVCRSRDSIYSRAGGECGINKFKTLVAEK